MGPPWALPPKVGKACGPVVVPTPACLQSAARLPVIEKEPDSIAATV